jgi:hypothetical protein
LYPLPWLLDAVVTTRTDQAALGLGDAAMIVIISRSPSSQANIEPFRCSLCLAEDARRRNKCHVYEATRSLLQLMQTVTARTRQTIQFGHHDRIAGQQPPMSLLNSRRRAALGGEP